MSRATLDWAISYLPRIYNRLNAKVILGIGRVDKDIVPLLDPKLPLTQRQLAIIPGALLHEVMVESMAAPSAYRIGADADVTRVASRFHDIAKILAKDLFLEATSGNREPVPGKVITNLKDLDTIMSHQANSFKLLWMNGFPEKICRIAGAHHGKLPTRAALSLELKWRLSSPLGQAMYLRYFGPIPDCPEGGILTIADQVEVVLRKLNLQDPREQTLREVVKDVGRYLRRAGQLANSSLDRIDQKEIEKAMGWWVFRLYNDLDIIGTPFPDDLSRFVESGHNLEQTHLIQS
jgi:cyclic-di-AMP phosphodiesterase PgpH